MVIPLQKTKRRRKRGVILTKVGLTRFQAAKAHAEYEYNQGNRYTLAELSEKTGVSMDTLTKVFACEVRVDKHTLKCCFRAFDLALESTDYHSPDPREAIARPGPPGGQMPPDSTFYIRRRQCDLTSLQAIDQPGALIRLKGSHQTGKTSLMSRLSAHSQQCGQQPVYISFQLAEKDILENLDRLLKWFCASVGLGLSIPPDLDTYWDSLFGSKISCKLYFEQYLLPTVGTPMLLMLDDVERLFLYPEVADEFFGFLRTCYEEAKTSSHWQQLRIVIAQTSEVYIPLNINKSPFNLGIAIPLPPFTPKQIQSLAAAYQLTWSEKNATTLCQLIDGQPYLSHLVVYQTWTGTITLEDVLAQRHRCAVFLPYFQQQQRKLQHSPALRCVLSRLLNHQSWSPAVLTDIYRLQSLGLVKLTEEGPQIACPLFTDYFSRHLMEA